MDSSAFAPNKKACTFSQIITLLIIQGTYQAKSCQFHVSAQKQQVLPWPGPIASFRLLLPVFLTSCRIWRLDGLDGNDGAGAAGARGVAARPFRIRIFGILGRSRLSIDIQVGLNFVIRDVSTVLLQ